MRSGDLYSGLNSLQTGRRVLEKGHVFVGNANNIEEPHTLGDGVFPLGKDNIWVGDQNCVAQESDKFKEMISKIITLRYELGLIEQNTTFILQSPSSLLSKAQALNSLPDGILTHKKGVVDSAALGAALFPFPSSSLPPIAMPNPTFSPLSPMDWLMSGPWLPQIMAGSPNSDNTQTETVVSSSLAMTQIKAAQAIKRLEYGSFVVKSRSMDFIWENPALAFVPDTIKALYGLNTSFSFSNALALDELGAGLLKNYQNGDLGLAVAGVDFVDVAPAAENMMLPLIRPENIVGGNDNAKLLSRCQFLPVNNLTSLTHSKIWQGDANNRPVEIDLPSHAPSDSTYVLLEPDVSLPNAQALSDLITLLTRSGLLKLNSPILEQPHITLASGGMGSDDDYVTPVNLRSVVTEIEGQILALTGYGSMALLIQALFNIGMVAGGYSYGQIIRGQTLNVKNKWISSDFNDEGHNAVGDFEFRFPSGYSSDDRGHGTLWFDSSGRNPDSASGYSEGGLRIFSWDSGGDHLIESDSPLAPVHMGIFGYQNKHETIGPNPNPSYKGFIFRSEFDNSDKTSPNYRFPVNFGLYCAQRRISNIGLLRYGWESIDKIFEYDYTNFSFFKNVKFHSPADFEDSVSFKKNISFGQDGTMTLPAPQEGALYEVAGMLRYRPN